MWAPWIRLLVITATFVAAYAIGRLIGRRFGMSKEKQLWLVFACFLLVLLVESIIYARLGPYEPKLMYQLAR